MIEIPGKPKQQTEFVESVYDENGRRPALIIFERKIEEGKIAFDIEPKVKMLTDAKELTKLFEDICKNMQETMVVERTIHRVMEMLANAQKAKMDADLMEKVRGDLKI